MLATAFVASACSGGSDSDRSEIPSAATDIMKTAPYAGAHWSYLVTDPADGKVVYSHRANEFVFLASVSKNFTVATVYDQLGADGTIETPVFATAEPTDGTLTGDLVLVASGDMALGGRGALDGKFNFAMDRVDHVYADVIPGAKLPEDNPLAGLDDLARQVSAAGIRNVNGDVLIDARKWDVLQAQEGPVPSIFVNDNLLDIEITPGAQGQEADLRMFPETSAFILDNAVTTSAEGTDRDVTITPDPNDPRTLRVTGTVPAGDSSVTVYRIPDAESWARTLFVEALNRAGVTVNAPNVEPDQPASLPDPASLTREVASLESPPMEQMGGMILATSYNTGANAFLCLLAAKAGSTDCDAGLPAIRELATKAEITPEQLVLVDGQGGDPASGTPEAVVKLMTFIEKQSWGRVFKEGLPRLGERGSLVTVGQDSPAKGKVIAKTGTTIKGEPESTRLFGPVQGLAGYLDVGTGRDLVFYLAVSNALFPDSSGIFQVNTDVAGVAAAFQQELAER